MADLFISYARKDADWVGRLAHALEQAGHSVWWDRQVSGGSRFSKVIEAELARAGAVIVVWSRDAVESHWVADEAAVARDSGKLVPVTLDGTAPPLGFRQFQVIDFAGEEGPGGAAFSSLMQALSAKSSSLHLKPDPGPPAVSGPAPGSDAAIAVLPSPTSPPIRSRSTSPTALQRN